MRWLVRLLISLFAVLVLFVIVATAFLMTFDPNDYKDRIALEIEKRSGRTVHFDGQIGLTFYPWLGVSLERVRLENPPGFSEPDMLLIGHADLRAALLPLLKGEFEIGTLVLHDLELSLERRADGRDNWADLLALARRESTVADSAGVSAGEAEPSAVALAIGGLDVQNGQLRYRDRLAGHELALTGIELYTEALTFDRPVDFRFTTGVSSSAPAFSGKLSLSGSLFHDIGSGVTSLTRPNLRIHGDADEDWLPRAFDARLVGEILQLSSQSGELAMSELSLTGNATEFDSLTYLDLTFGGDLSGNWLDGQYELAGMTLDTRLRGMPTRTGELAGTLSAELAVDLGAGTAHLDRLNIVSDPLHLQGRLSIGRLLAEQGPVISGPIELLAFNPRELAEAMNYAVPPMRSEAALTHFALEGHLDASPAEVMLRGAVLELDGHRFEGELGVADLPNERLRVVLAGGEFDVTPYLPPPPEQVEEAEVPLAGASRMPRGLGGSDVERGDEAIDLPVEILRELNAELRLTLERLVLLTHRFDYLTLVFKASNGDLTVERLDFNAFEGLIRSQSRLDVRGDVPGWRLALDARDVALQPLLEAALREDRLLGKGQLLLDVNTTGRHPSSMKAGLNGRLQFELRDGAIRGFNIAHALRQAQARLAGGRVESPAQLQTDFTSITGTANIRNGVLDNQDLRGASPLLRVEGAGQVDIAREQIDYRARAMVVGTLTGQDGRALDELRQIPVPIRLTGSLRQPRVAIDLEALLRERAEQELRRRATKEIERRLLPGSGDRENGSRDPVDQLRRLLPF